MAKTDVLEVFDSALNDPGALKSGEYLEEHIVNYAKEMFINDRTGVIDALREWLVLREEPKTMLAVKVVEELTIKELKEEIINLKKDIEGGKAFLPFYVRSVDKALSVLK